MATAGNGQYYPFVNPNDITAAAMASGELFNNNSAIVNNQPVQLQQQVQQIQPPSIQPPLTVPKMEQIQSPANSAQNSAANGIYGTNSVQKAILGLKQKYNDLDNYAKIVSDPTEINLARAKQAELAQMANIYRNTANELGLDLRGFGADDTLEKSAQTYQLNAARKIRDLMNLPSIEEQQKKYYDEIRQLGASPRLARKALAQESAKIHGETMRRLMNGVQEYGTNPDGSINGIGLALIGRMVSDNPQAAATLFSNAFALPKNVFEANNQTAMNDTRLKSAAELAELQRALKLREMQQNQSNKDREYNRNVNNDEFNHERDAQRLALDIAKAQNNATQNKAQTPNPDLGKENYLKYIDKLLQEGRFDDAQAAYEQYVTKEESDVFKAIEGENPSRIINHKQIIEKYLRASGDENQTAEEQAKVLENARDEFEISLIALHEGMSLKDARVAYFQRKNQGKRNSPETSNSNADNGNNKVNWAKVKELLENNAE